LGPRKGDSAEVAVIELLGAEQELSEKAAKREEARNKKREELQKQLEAAEGNNPNSSAS
jgi:large subunit ribosomal protein L17